MVHEIGIHPNDPFRYRCNMMSTELLKIQIVPKPYRTGNDAWNYFLITVFDKMIAIMRGRVDSHWKILNATGLALSRYVDAVQDFQDRICAVTKPHGDVFLWEPSNGVRYLHYINYFFFLDKGSFIT